MKNLLTALCLCILIPAKAQFTIVEPFTQGLQGTNLAIGGDAILTSGNADPSGDGWLRLTGMGQNQTGYLYVNEAFPTNLGVLAEFDYLSWKNSNAFSTFGADGICMILWDGSVPFNIGSFGGGLGYTPGDTTIPVPGVQGAYMGVGLDEFGNFSNPSRFLNNAALLGGPGITPDAIVVRNAADSNYYYLAGAQLPVNGSIVNGDDGGIDYKGISATRPLPADFYRRIQYEIIPVSGSYRVIVRMKQSENGPFVELLNFLSATPLPATMKMAFSATTGSFVNFHEIRNLSITTPGNISILKEGVGVAHIGDTIDYKLIIRNSSINPLTGISLIDTLPPNFVMTGYQVNNSGNVSNQIYNIDTATTRGIITASCDIVNDQDVALIVNGYFNNSLPTSGSYRNMAYVIAPSGFTDTDPSNDTAEVFTTLLGPLALHLTDFQGKAGNHENKLSWTTNEEKNVCCFEIAYSENGKDFSAFVNLPANNTAGVHNYSYNHFTTAAITYYRLKMINTDGSFTYSPVIRLLQEKQLTPIISPNPFVDKIYITAQAGTAYEISITDATGRNIRQQNFITANDNMITISNLSQLCAGVYFIKITDPSGQSVIQKLIH